MSHWLIFWSSKSPQWEWRWIWNYNFYFHWISDTPHPPVESSAARAGSFEFCRRLSSFGSLRPPCCCTSRSFAIQARECRREERYLWTHSLQEQSSLAYRYFLDYLKVRRLLETAISKSWKIRLSKILACLAKPRHLDFDPLSRQETHQRVDRSHFGRTRRCPSRFGTIHGAQEIDSEFLERDKRQRLAADTPEIDHKLPSIGLSSLPPCSPATRSVFRHRHHLVIRSISWEFASILDKNREAK